MKSSCKCLAFIVLFSLGCNGAVVDGLKVGEAMAPIVSPIEAQPLIDKSAQGETQARADFRAGIVQVIEFGELPPYGYVDRSSGLPLGSMGCEVSEEEAPYRDAYNRTMKAMVAAKTPFPPELDVVYKVDQDDQHDVVQVTADQVLVNGKVHPTILEDRLKVGLLARSRPNTPARPAEGQTRWSLTVADRSGTWSSTWGEEGPLVSSDLLSVLEKWRAGG